MTPTETANKLLENFSKLNKADKWNQPFPMGVFGTLRQSGGNHRLMHKNGIYCEMKKAFLPHFIADGLTIYHEENSTAPFEIYYYEPSEWKKMIWAVDALEGFEPDYESYGHYHRTLVWLNILPYDFKSDLFEKYGRRDLKIDNKDWDKYEKVPCWVYSGQSANERVKKMIYNPVIWY